MSLRQHLFHLILASTCTALAAPALANGYGHKDAPESEHKHADKHEHKAKPANDHHHDHAHGHGHDHAHSHGADAPAKWELNDGKKWPTDAVTRKSMQQVQRLLAPYAKRAPRPEQVKALAVGLEDQVSAITQQAKLIPGAHGVMQLLLADIARAIPALDQADTNQEAMAMLHFALKRYAEFFVHPGWKAS